jgi:hypothetical protein
MNLSGVVGNFRDAVQLLGMDWFVTGRRKYWHAARWQLRTLRFRAHANITPIELGDLVRRISNRNHVEEVALPSPATDFGGVGDPQYYYAIGSICRGVSPLKVIEVGTFLGVSTLTVALNTSPNCMIHTIDLPEQDPSTLISGLNWSDSQLVKNSRGRVGKAFMNHPCSTRIVQVRSNSAEMDFRAVFGHAELVIVDGGHSAELIKKDSDNAFAVLKPGGVILWDDYWWCYPDVVEYLDTLSRQQLRRIEGTNLIVYSENLA